MSHDDELFSSLRSLPELDVTTSEALRAKKASLAAFASAHERARQGDVTLVGPAFLKWTVPLGLAAVVFVYLQWAVSAATALAR